MSTLADPATRARVQKSLEACHARFVELYPPTVVQPAKGNKDAFVPANSKVTSAYVALLVAHAAATQQATEIAEKLVREARKLLGHFSDPVHAFALDGFMRRIEAAGAGEPLESPWPLATRRTLGRLPAFERYKADRIRMFSYLLEPLERTAPAVGFQGGVAEIGGPEFTPLRSLESPGEIEARLAKLLTAAVRARDPKAVNMVENALDFLPLLPRDRARGLLRKLTGPRSSDALLTGRVVEKAIVVAVYLGDDRLIGRIVDTVVSRMRYVCAFPFGRALWRLRASGRVRQAETLAGALVTSPSAFRGGAQLAGEFAISGDLRRARRHMDRFVDHLATARIGYAGVLASRSIAFALTGMPPDYGLDVLQRLAAHSGRISDSFSTNSHLSIVALGLMDAIVLGHEVVATSSYLA